MHHLLFDLDGTLTDPRDGILNGLRAALVDQHVPVPPDSELTRWIGPPLRIIFAKLLPTPGPADIERAVAVYREHYDATGWSENRVYPGIPEALATLTAQGFALYVATSKLQRFASRILEHFGLARHFHGIYGSELAGRFDYKPDLVQHIVETHALRPADATMIGDRREDIVAGRAHGLSTTGVLWGFGDRAELTAAGGGLTLLHRMRHRLADKEIGSQRITRIGRGQRRNLLRKFVVTGHGWVIRRVNAER